MKKHHLGLIIALTLILPLNACSQDRLEVKPHSKKMAVVSEKSDKPTIETLRQHLQELKKEIKHTIGSAGCTDTKQCSALPIGRKACGGPQSYLAYSSDNTDTTKLLELAKQHQQTSQIINQLTGAMSDCMIATPPVFICNNSRCEPG
ncbi:MAG: hypothetical protein OEM38_02055 [Gammaproteobacteria bacterium]|nr:hypothetical protein [Gammaproteobacteria bacterium]